MFIVYDENMNVKEFPQGLRPLDIFISSISKERHAQDVEGKSGRVSSGQTSKYRPISTSLGLFSSDTQDYRLLRDQAYAFFGDEEFYISETYQPGKRYKVTVTQSYAPVRLNRWTASVDFELETVDLPFGESIKTTADIDREGLNYGDGWSYGMGLLQDEESHIYTHTGRSFKIYNAGNEHIHPFEQDLKIELSDVVGSTSFLELKNITNGTTFRVKEAVSSNQEVVLDGPNITRNNAEYLRLTNRQFIELVPGWNEFAVTGATSARVFFDFRFYYK